MGFEFTGTPPMLLNNANGRTSFASFLQATKNHGNEGAVAPNSNMVFGRVTPLGEASRLQMNKAHGAHTNTKAVVADKTTGQDSLLQRALGRLERSRPAIIGVKEMAADKALKKHLQDGADMPPMLAGIRKIEPEAAAFVESLFADYVDHLVGASLTMPVNEYSPIALTNEYPPVSPVEYVNDADSDATYVLEITRQDPAIKAFSRALADELFDNAFVRHAEGARVLAEFIIREVFAGVEDYELEQVIMETLGCTSLTRIHGLVDAVYREVWKLDTDFRARELHAEDFNREKTPCNDKSRQLMAEHSNAHATQPEYEAVHPWAESANWLEQPPFRFLDLPAELREWVYKELVAPHGWIVLSHIDFSNTNSDTEYGHTSRRSVESGCQLEILEVSKQIYNEARPVLHRDNTICVKIAIDNSSRPCLDNYLLPRAVLSLLSSMTLVLDFEEDSEANNLWIDRVNWYQLQSLTNLKKLRICFVQSVKHRGRPHHTRFVLKNVLERIPSDCELSFESKAIHEIDFVEEVVDEHDAYQAVSSSNASAGAYEVPGNSMHVLVEEVKNMADFTMGSKSGDERDYRFPARTVLKSVQQLIADGEADPRSVLGGGQ